MRIGFLIRSNDAVWIARLILYNIPISTIRGNKRNTKDNDKNNKAISACRFNCVSFMGSVIKLKEGMAKIVKIKENIKKASISINSITNLFLNSSSNMLLI
jgi:hypothetical protein